MSFSAEPPTRSIWSGRISIGLVNVPVKIFTMVRDRSFSFKLVRRSDACPIKYVRVCSRDGETVEWSEIAKAYEVKKGEYVIFSQEELGAITPESDKKIKIDKFVPLSSVNNIYYNRTYILAPEESARDSYSLMLSALRDMSMAAVGKFTLRTKDHPVLIQAYEEALILRTLRYSYEVVDPIDIEDLYGLPKPSESELELAYQIIENLSDEFDITEFEDSFRERVEELIEKKMKGETIIIEEEPKTEEVKELMAALQATLQQLQVQ